MKLSREELEKNSAEFKAAGFEIPTFDYDKASSEAGKAPIWIHFGAGNIFRAFQANLWQKLLNEKIAKAGLIVAEGYDYEIIDKGYRPFGNLSVLATLKSTGTVEKTVIGSISESLILDRANDGDFRRLTEIFEKPSLQMASFTITEKGYAVKNQAGEILPFIEADLCKGPEKAESYLGKLVSLVYFRFKAGSLPMALVSMDNCSHNGDKLETAVLTIAEGWVKNGLADPEFMDYLKDRSKITFPWSMIDKITPRPDMNVRKMLTDTGLELPEAVVTSKNTYIAPFVNAEECEYLVIEDTFPNGRPALEKAGVYFTDRETVNRVEKMKVCTCLNPLHTALAVYGCLLGYTLIADEMKDEQLVKLVKRIGYVEGMPVVVNPGIISPEKFLDQVVNVRIPNPFMPDTPQRIATDTSQKLPIRYGETIKAYIRDGRNPDDLKLIPLVFAGWLRYLMAVDDNGNSFTPSSDPLLSVGQEAVSGIALGTGKWDDDTDVRINKLLSNDSIFGVNLVEIGMSELVKSYFKELIAGKGAVRETLKKYTA